MTTCAVARVFWLVLVPSGGPRFKASPFEPNCAATCDLAAVGPVPLLENPRVMASCNRVTAQSPVLLQDRPSNYARKVGAMVPLAGTLMNDWVAMRATTRHMRGCAAVLRTGRIHASAR